MQTITHPAPDALRVDTWAIVDLFGHARIAGRLSEHQIGGQSFVRVDVPEVTDKSGTTPAHTRLFGAGAIYSVAFVDEMTATLAARDIHSEPVSTWSMRNAIAALPQAERARILGIDLAAPGADRSAVSSATHFTDDDWEA